MRGRADLDLLQCGSDKVWVVQRFGPEGSPHEEARAGLRALFWHGRPSAGVVLHGLALDILQAPTQSLDPNHAVGLLSCLSPTRTHTTCELVLCVSLPEECFPCGIITQHSTQH